MNSTPMEISSSSATLDGLPDEVIRLVCEKLVPEEVTVRLAQVFDPQNQTYSLVVRPIDPPQALRDFLSFAMSSTRACQFAYELLALTGLLTFNLRHDDAPPLVVAKPMQDEFFKCVLARARRVKIMDRYGVKAVLGGRPQTQTMPYSFEFHQIVNQGARRLRIPRATVNNQGLSRCVVEAVFGELNRRLQEFKQTGDVTAEQIFWLTHLPTEELGLFVPLNHTYPTDLVLSVLPRSQTVMP